MASVTLNITKKNNHQNKFLTIAPKKSINLYTVIKPYLGSNNYFVEIFYTQMHSLVVRNYNS